MLIRRKPAIFLGFLAIAPVPAHSAGSGNKINDRLLSLAPAEQAENIAHNVGQNCVGVESFAMGVTTRGKAKGFAYWSVRCKDGRSFALQIAPNGDIFVADCQVLKANGKECFKKF